MVLIVRDGWGKNPYPQWNQANAVYLAKHPVADRLLAEYPNTLIHTSGFDVGLPEGTMGNSEVGHQNIGAGRIVDQESVRITKQIRNGEFYDNVEINAAVSHAWRRDRPAPVRHRFRCGRAWALGASVRMPGALPAARTCRGCFSTRSPMAATHLPIRAADMSARSRRK